VELNQPLYEELIERLAALDKLLASQQERANAPGGVRAQLADTVALTFRLLSVTVDRSGDDILLWHTEPACLVPTHPDVEAFLRETRSVGVPNETSAFRADHLLLTWARDVLNSLQSGLSTTSVFDSSRLELASLREQLDALWNTHSTSWTVPVTQESHAVESVWRTLTDTSRYLVRTGDRGGDWPLVRAVQLILSAVIGEAGDVVLMRVFSPEQLAQLASLLGRVAQGGTDEQRAAQLWAASLTVQLRTLEAYSEILEPSDRADMYVRFSEHVFTPLAPAGQVNELKVVPAEVVRLLGEAAAVKSRRPEPA